jgi:subtilisin family serine protease
MKHKAIQRFFVLSASLIGSFCLTACGQFGPEFMDQSEPPLPVVRLTEPQAVDSGSSVRGSYIVMFRTERTKSNLFFASFAAEYAHHYSILSDNFLSDSRVKDIDVISTIDLGSIQDVEWESEFDGPSVLANLFDGPTDDASAGVMARVDFDSEDSAKALLQEWESDKKIWFAEPNEISRLSAGEFGKWASSYETFQAWYGAINLPAAMRALAAEKKPDGAQGEDATINANTMIAVMDSGVDYEHPQLKDNMWVNSSVGSAGCPNDVHGCNTTAPKKGTLGNGDVWPNQASGPGVACNDGADRAKCNHGTHVAGIIAAKPSGASDASKYGGVCPFCKIMAIKVAELESSNTSGEPSIRDDSQLRAFKYLTRFRKSGATAVRLVNASFGKYGRSRSQAILIDVLKRVGTGTLVIAAASNEDSVIRSYPAAFSNVIAVASVGTDSDQTSVQKSSFSNYGSWVDIAAPGYGLLSTYSGGRAQENSGTSMAAPAVAGAAGILLSAFPNLSFNELRERIVNSSNSKMLYVDGKDAEVNVQYYYPKISGEPVRRPLLGGGYLDVLGMLKKDSNSATGQPIERVTSGCAVIGLINSDVPPFVLILLLLAPIIMSITRTKGNKWVI